MQDLISIAEASMRLGVHATTLRSWVRDGRVRSYRLGARFVRVSWSETLASMSAASRSDRLEVAPARSEVAQETAAGFVDPAEVAPTSVDPGGTDASR
jgi:excisionase family DNA binding protein